MFGLHNLHIEIPFGNGVRMIYICGGLTDLQTFKLFLPPLNRLCLNSIPRRGIFGKSILMQFY